MSRPFAFVGRLPSSPVMSRQLLLVRSYQSELRIETEVGFEGPQDFERALSSLEMNQSLPVGADVSLLRPLVLRASRLAGVHRFEGAAALDPSARAELTKLLRQVGVGLTPTPLGLSLEGEGWKMHGDTMLLPNENAGTVAAAVLLNCWDLPFDAYVSLGGRRLHDGEWRLAVRTAQELGMKIDFWDSDFRVPKNQVATASRRRPEIDLVAAFALAAVAAVNGQATFLDFPENSLQPAEQFVPILERMGVPFAISKHSLKVERAPRLNAVVVTLKSAPELFPGLAALCALAEGESELLGLAPFETDRMDRMTDLIQRLGRKVERKAGGLRIFGPTLKPSEVRQPFDCNGEPLLAVAAAIFLQAGYPLEVGAFAQADAVFPGFWRAVGINH